MRCTLFLLLLLALSLAAGAQDSAAAPSSAPASVQTELRLERRLLSLDLVSYKTRERERRAREQVSAVLGRLDQALASDAMSLGNLETLRDQLAAAREAAHTAEVRLDSQLASLQERMRRIALLEGDGGGPARPADALTGRWRVTVLPQNFAATFDLRLNGTVVSGTYQIDGGGSGSFRGSLAGGKLRLERIDAQGGADSLWEGTLGTNRIDDGTWGTHELVTGQPPRGKWTAVRESGR
jgi:TolA-binding protein